MKKYQPQIIYIDPLAKDWPLTAEILARLPGIPVREITDLRAEMEKNNLSADPIGAGKRVLYLAYDKGNSFKPFPETEDYLSCDYYTLHLSEGCDLECSYCILQAYLTNPFLTVYVNLTETLDRLQNFLSKHPDQLFRIGTGQLADSLSLDHISALTETLVPFFKEQSNAVVELKTKSDNIERLLPLSSDGKVIISWSMNTELIQKKEEHKTATLEERLLAAERICNESDHRVAFHFDPIIDYSGWEEDYQETIQKIFDRIPEERIAWMSLGCLRFIPALKPIMETRFPKSGLPTAEWIKGLDGKMRYFKPRRIEIYKSIVEKIRARAKNVTLYLSMETPEVWSHVFGGEHDKTTICKLLNDAALHGQDSSSFVTETLFSDLRDF
jgi:spore photoproduct lyase